jgi:hypothetical protein
MSSEPKESAIARSVKASLQRLGLGNYEGALKDICGAIEGTLKKGIGGGGKQYKAWVAANLDLILAVGFPGLRTAKLSIAYEHPALPVSVPPKPPSLEEIIYHVVRCELYHTGGLPENIEFSDGTIGASGPPDRRLILPRDFVLGLVLAVVTSNANATDSIKGQPLVICNGIPIGVNSFWGKKQALIDSLAYVRMATNSRSFHWTVERVE